MDFDVESLLGAVERSVSLGERNGLPVRAVTPSRAFETAVDNLWNAVTSGERIPRWFLPISGELEPGGHYQLEGNAGGLITECEAQSRFSLNWEFAGDTSWVDVHLALNESGHIRLTLTHTTLLSEHWHEYGPGAVGVGWELALVGLRIYLSDPDQPMPDEAELRRINGRQGDHRGQQRELGTSCRCRRRGSRPGYTGGVAHHSVLHPAKRSSPLDRPAQSRVGAWNSDSLVLSQG